VGVDQEQALNRRAPRTDPDLLGARYRLGALLGHGSAGRVYEALDTLLGRRVAVKVYQTRDNPFGRYRFAGEARLLASLSHPGLVDVHDVCLDGEEPFLVLRLVDGPTLRRVLDNGPLEPSAVARIGARLADVLAYLHAHDIVHRDIKPSNVLMDDTGACHLTDFGLARALNSAHFTASGEIVGTAAYLAPEQVTSTDAGPPADVYALGLVLLECLTGHTEYTGTTIETALGRLSRQPHVPETLPPAWRDLLTAMTAKEPTARPPAERCAEVLRAISHNGPVPTTLPLSLPRPREATEPTSALREPIAAGPRRHRPARPRPAHAGLTALALAASMIVAGSTIADSANLVPEPSAERVQQQSTPPVPVTPAAGKPAPPPAEQPTAPLANVQQRPTPASYSQRQPKKARVAPAPNPKKERGQQDNRGAGKNKGKR
jgi:eukaryotic-like serine/threonine-protein kinase